MARLRVVSGPLAGQTIDVENEVVIGREDTDLTIDDVELSRRHAVVRPFASRLQVEDLGSTNGTYVDGTRIEEPTLLGGGAEIQLGMTVLVVEGVLPAGRDAAEPATGETSGAQVTRQRAIPPELQKKPAGQPAAAGASARAGAAASPAPPTMASPAAPAAPAQPLAPFHPPEHRRQRGLASRSWVPVALSFGTVMLTAIALVLYFALR
jgi:predicted component of type VI protein secretion system